MAIFRLGVSSAIKQFGTSNSEFEILNFKSQNVSLSDSWIKSYVIPPAMPGVVFVVQQIVDGEQVSVDRRLHMTMLRMVRVEIDHHQQRFAAVRRLLLIGNDFR